MNENIEKEKLVNDLIKDNLKTKINELNIFINGWFANKRYSEYALKKIKNLIEEKDKEYGEYIPSDTSNIGIDEKVDVSYKTKSFDDSGLDKSVYTMFATPKLGVEFLKLTSEEKTKEESEFKDLLHFYLDSFFVFLYSLYDILAQIINLCYSQLNEKEKDVTFLDIKDIFEEKQIDSDLLKKLRDITKDDIFCNIMHYRHCAIHRRRIYIEKRSKLERKSGDNEYISNNIKISFDWLICDDPYELNPKTNKNREIVTYCKKAYYFTTNILNEVFDILKRRQ